MKKIICLILALLMMTTTVLFAAAEENGPTEPAAAEEAIQPTEPATEPATDAATEAPTEAPTEPPTEPPTEAPTEPAVDPHITDISPANGGIKISFTAFPGAAKYRVFTKKADGSGWKGIGGTSALSFTRTGLTPYSSDIYTVRALGSNGKYCSAYDKQGYRYTYLPVPVLKKAESIPEGVKITWNPVSGAPGYRFYVKAANGWRLLTETAECSFVDTQVISGSSYTYTVKVYDTAAAKPLSYFDRTGVTVKYVATPRITSAAPVQEGMKIAWNSVKGAVKYRVFYKVENGWKTIGNTTSASYTFTNPIKGKEYIYTVRVTDANGKYISGYDKTGVAATCLSTPVLKKAESVTGGVKVSWDAVYGAQQYRVYRKNGSGWKGICNTGETSVIDPDVASGAHCTYTVRAIDPETGAMMSYFDRGGVSVRYVAAPRITAFAPAEGGTQVTWSSVAGAVRYRLFYKVENGWKTIGNTAGTTLNHMNPEPGREYLYTVRATDSNGKYISGYYSEGWSYRYIAPVALTSVTPADPGMLLEWEATEGAAIYRVYRRSFGGAWTAVVNTPEVIWQDTTAAADTLYTYTLRTYDENGKVNSFYLRDTPYYCNGVLAEGSFDIDGVPMLFVGGHVRQGYVTVGGKTYYYNEAGTLMKNGIVGSQSEGYRYADSEGVIDNKARLAVSQDGVDWNVLDGRAYKVTTAKDRTMFRALRQVAKLTSATDTKSQKLRKCFNYLQTETYEYNPRVPHYRGMDWPVIYADDIFTTGGGNCLSYAAAFAFMAKAIGYDNVYACHSGGHGWTEIGGLVYDSEWQRSHHTYSYYGLSYYTSTDVDYLGVKVEFPYNAWMHIEI